MRSEPSNHDLTPDTANPGVGRDAFHRVRDFAVAGTLPFLISGGVEPVPARVTRRLLPLLCLAALLTASCSRTELAPSGEAREVSRQFLVQRDGRFFLTGTTNPFTGLMVEQYGDGSRKSCSAIANGLLHGSSEGYYTNGQPQVREQFQAGVAHGLRTKWHPNGQQLSEVSIFDGKLEGTFRCWHENGALAEEVQMSHGQPEGLSRAYFPSGAVKAEARLHHGQLLEQKFWKDREFYLTDRRSASN